MSYKYATENINYEDYSSGRVFYNQYGATSFPVRLTSEIFQRCANILKENGVSSPYSIYDPCCGGAYLLTTIGYLFGNRINKIYASDIDRTVLELAKKNLSLLTQSGLNNRIEEINKMISVYGKESHHEALQSALRLKDLLSKIPHSIDINCFMCDATKTDTINTVNNINMVITDLPYGDIVSWVNASDENEAIFQLLDNLLPKLSTNAVVAIISKKKTAVRHNNYKRVDRFKIGKRQVTLLCPLS
ncbi:hypothetical protein KQI42_04305 [Tissierella sp. MSJ-40]|uniref:rRNA methyltransferase AviRa n=1 Tax=Tissierella simiarum TaxID=2841534 RepID=A0ABS6E2U9_9FIRM|nr:hypothetical protein [Tissierella simiarum]MBU5437218.1 hypothetical protein [Tissierella simiarum]